jgi:rubredoxin-NAD+ reductase
LVEKKANVVIIGSGLGGYTLARELRKTDADIGIHILTRDSGRAYSKPMLSNAIAKGKDADALAMKTPEAAAEDFGATIETGVEIMAIKRDQSLVSTSTGDVTYDKLVLALGADQINLPLEGDGVDGVLQVNDLEDYGQFRDALGDSPKRITIIGAGLIGCEFANDLVPAGHQVQVVDLADWPMSRFVPQPMGDALRDALRAAGVEWHLGTSVSRVSKSDNGYSVLLASGATLESDLVLSAVGLRARTQLAADAGLDVDCGIQVNAALQTSDPCIYALGDCAEVTGRVLPFVMPLMTCARALAKTLSGDLTDVVYPPMPVVVKTPACPTVVLPPDAGVDGAWQLEGDAPDLTARFVGPNGALLGFALTGGATSSRQALVKEMTA